MVDPISAAGPSAAKALASVLTKRLQSQTGVRLGSRDERRQVYDRFQAAVMDANGVVTAVLLEQQLYTPLVGKRRWRFTFQPFEAQRAAKEALHKLTHVRGQVLHAYLDLRLVANPAPLRAAHAVLEQAIELFQHGTSSTADEVMEATNKVVEAQREFTDVCRDDLWYLPQWWQIYRKAWWSARRWRRHGPT